MNELLSGRNLSIKMTTNLSSVFSLVSLEFRIQNFQPQQHQQHTGWNWSTNCKNSPRVGEEKEFQSIHNQITHSCYLQVLELTDALAVNSTAIRLEWHLLLSDTEYFIEVIHWNNLIDFVIQPAFSLSTNRASTFAIETWAVTRRNSTASPSWSPTARCTMWAIWTSSRNTSSSSHRSTEASRVSRATRKLYKHSRMVSWKREKFFHWIGFIYTILLSTVPTAAPANVQVGMLNLTSGVVRWSPPPEDQINGALLGYKIQVKAGNSTKILAQMTLNSSTLSVGLHNLTTGATYSIRVCGYTRVGAGPYSKLVNFFLSLF